MTAARFRLSGDARRRWRPWLALALLAGLAAGVVMASVAAAQRADSAFGRRRRWSIAANIQLDAGPDALSEFEDFGLQTAEPQIGIADLARLVLAALVVAVPSGIAGRRWFWTLFADDLGIVPAPVVPLVAVVVLLAAALVVTNLIMVLPGRSAAATHPAPVLHSE